MRALTRLFRAARDGKSGVLVVHGEPGVGKSALLQHTLKGADGFRLLRTSGVECEMELPFAALHQLFASMPDCLGHLPDPQRDALRTALGLATGPVPDRYLVGLAVLTLLSEVARDQPLACVVDDAQWLDRASEQALAFAARRLQAESVVMVFVTRQTGQELDALPGLEVKGLTDADATELLKSVVQWPLDNRVRDQIVAETHGNPLALLELPRGLSPGQLAGGFGLYRPVELSGRIEAGFLRRLEALPDETRLLLLVAAAEPVGDPTLVFKAAGQLGAPASAAAAAEAEGLVVIGARVTFRHPLVRSAVYGAASLKERRAAHLSLAEVTDRDADPDRRAWHLAAAAAGPDEMVALELESSAGRARARGGITAAAAFLQRASALSEVPARRAERALAAARLSLRGGDFEAALGMLASAEAGPVDELRRALIELVRGQVAFASNAGSDALPLLLKAAQRLEQLDPELARDTLLDAWGAALFAGRLGGPRALLEVSRAALSAPPPPRPPRPSDLLLDGLALLVTEGRAAAAPALRRAASALAAEEVPSGENFRWGWLTTVPSNVLWDDASLHAINVRQLQAARNAGALANLPIDLTALAVIVAWWGNFEDSAAAILEAGTVKDATGSRMAPYGAMFLAALRGQGPEASALVELTVKDATAAGQGIAVQYADWVSAVLNNGLSRYAEAFAAAERASQDTPQLFLAAWALPELIEAASRTGRAEEAARAVERLTEATSPGGTDWGLGIEARSRALLSEGPRAEKLYLEAIDRLGRTRFRTEHARAHLLYGEWLRRDRRRLEARRNLRIAHEMFFTMRMEGFAERARVELVATGERVRKRSVETRYELTPQEQQIVRLVGAGLSNPEIGARLFISARTVEWHLHKVFAKLGVASRGELKRAFPHFEPVRVPS